MHRALAILAQMLFCFVSRPPISLLMFAGVLVACAEGRRIGIGLEAFLVRRAIVLWATGSLTRARLATAEV